MCVEIVHGELMSLICLAGEYAQKNKKLGRSLTDALKLVLLIGNIIHSICPHVILFLNFYSKMILVFFFFMSDISCKF